MRPTLPFESGVLPPCAAAARLLAMTVAALLMAPLQCFFVVFHRRQAFILPRRFHRLLIALLGFQVRAQGAPAAEPPILFVANHASYLDIPVLGSLIEASFIAKAEVASWPIIGGLAKMQNTVFVERRASQIAQQREQLLRRLAKGHSLVLFAEGTSSDGLRALPFKSSLFSIAEQALGAESAGKPFTIQPVSITCTQLDGLPLTRLWRPFYAWYGDMTLAGHLWNVLKFGRFTVEVIFHAPVSTAAFPNRKAMAQYCQEQVARGIEHSRTAPGRTTPDAKAAPLLAAMPAQPDED